MAFTDLEKYYDNIKKSYFRALKLIEEFDKEHKEGVIEDADFEDFKNKVAKFRLTYETIAYFFMLWARPTPEEKEKVEAWEKEHEGHTLDYLSERVPDKIIEENKHLIDDITKFLEDKKSQ